MNLWKLPTSLTIGGVGFDIRSDFRAILDILRYYQEPDYSDFERMEICLTIFYPGYDPACSMEQKAEMLQACFQFIDMGIKDDGRERPKTMDWDQDARIIIPSINRVLGTEIRSLKYMHWWTFLGAYMEIGDGLFAQVVSVRNKRARGKKLEKWEREFEKENKDIVRLKRKISAEQEEKERVETEAAEAEVERILKLLNGDKN